MLELCSGAPLHPLCAFYAGTISKKDFEVKVLGPMLNNNLESLAKPETNEWKLSSYARYFAHPWEAWEVVCAGVDESRSARSSSQAWGSRQEENSKQKGALEFRRQFGDALDAPFSERRPKWLHPDDNRSVDSSTSTEVNKVRRVRQYYCDSVVCRQSNRSYEWNGNGTPIYWGGFIRKTWNLATWDKKTYLTRNTHSIKGGKTNQLT